MENALSDRTIKQIVDREYLELRGKLLELAASFDRIGRGKGDSDPRLELIRKGIDLLSDDQPDKAQRIQHLFSREYSEDWRSDLGV